MILDRGSHQLDHLTRREMLPCGLIGQFGWKTKSISGRPCASPPVRPRTSPARSHPHARRQAEVTAPYDTGEFVASAASRQLRASRNRKAWEIRFDAAHAIYVEAGTRPHRIRARRRKTLPLLPAPSRRRRLPHRSQPPRHHPHTLVQPRHHPTQMGNSTTIRHNPHKHLTSL